MIANFTVVKILWDNARNVPNEAYGIDWVISECNSI